MIDMQKQWTACDMGRKGGSATGPTKRRFPNVPDYYRVLQRRRWAEIKGEVARESACRLWLAAVKAGHPPGPAPE